MYLVILENFAILLKLDDFFRREGNIKEALLI